MLQDNGFTLKDLRRSYANGVQPSETVREVYRRIEAIADPALFIHLRAIEDVLAEADGLPSDPTSLPLWGIPFVVKDNIDVAGLPTTAACPAFEYDASADAFVVARLRKAGALVIGKTNLDQFATGLVGVRTPYGVPRNAVNPDLVPGGSSSGSGVAVAHRIVPFSLGTDTAGSGRVPAAMNNIVGLKPTLGALSNSGVVPACRTLDAVSIFALTVDDAYAILEATCGYDDEDAYSAEVRIGTLHDVPNGLRIGVPTPSSREFFGDTRHADMFDAALKVLESHEQKLVEVDFTPLYAVADMLYDGAWIAERHAVVESLMRDRPDALHPTTAQIIGAANGLSATDAFRGVYRLKELSRFADKVLADIDLLCVPSIPTFYTRTDLDADPITPNSNLGTYTNFVNLLDLCGIAVPTAPRTDGLPGSVTLLARRSEDSLVASVARLFERKAPASSTAFSTHKEHSHAGKVTLAVCGAHMSGLPLNRELTSLGATLLCTTRTAANYRLYALAGGPPHRPGLLRCNDGGQIELEVWGLPSAKMGQFLNGIPSPLSIGTIQLQDGTYTHGFLVEAAGLDGAQDITHFGGWRGFLSTKDVA
ncbi:MAG: allophanate hydrolase [Pseudomonadota bacterium]